MFWNLSQVILQYNIKMCACRRKRPGASELLRQASGGYDIIRHEDYKQYGIWVGVWLLASDEWKKKSGIAAAPDFILYNLVALTCERLYRRPACG